MTKAEKRAQVEEIIDLKAQGFSDVQIRKELGLDNKAFDARIKFLHENSYFKIQALSCLVETIHRLRWLRMKAHNHYAEMVKTNQMNAATAAMKRLIEIDIAIPKIAEQLGWRPDELDYYMRTQKKTKNLKSKSEDELYQEYRRIVGADA